MNTEDRIQEALRARLRVVKDGKTLLVDSYYIAVGSIASLDGKKYRKRDFGIWDEIPN